MQEKISKGMTNIEPYSMARKMSFGTLPNGAKKKDEDLTLFRSIYKHEKDWIDAKGQYPFHAMAHLKIPTEPEKDDYDWLMSPPAENYDMGPNVPMPWQKPITQPLSRSTGNTVASKSGAQRSISPNWKTSIPPRHSSPNDRPSASLAEQIRIENKSGLCQKMHQFSALLDFENPEKASLTDKLVNDRGRHLRKNMSASNSCRSIGTYVSVKSADSKCREMSSRVRSTMPPENPKSTDQTSLNSGTGRSISASRTRSSMQVPSFNMEHELTTPLSQVPSSKVVSMNCTKESNPNLYAVCLASFKFLDHGPSNMRTARSHSVSRVNSNLQIPFTSKPEPQSQISSSTCANRNCKQESNLNPSTIPTKNHKFLDANASESRLNRSKPISHLHSSTHIYSGSNKLDPIIQHSQLSSSSSITKDHRRERNPNVLTIPPPNLRKGRSLSFSRVHSNSQIPWYNSKPEPIIQSSQISSSSGVTKNHKHEIHTLIGSTQKENIEHGSRARIVGSKLVDKILKARMTNAEEREFRSKQDTLVKERPDERRQSIETRQRKPRFNTSIYDSSCFSRSISKTSLDMALKHMELRRFSSFSAANSIMSGSRTQELQVDN